MESKINLEDFKPIPEWEDYLINCSGDVYSIRKKSFIIPSLDNRGYLHFTASVNGRRKTIRLHRVVAELFIDNPNKYNLINHIDSNKQNNHYKNLEWCTASHNIRHFLINRINNGGVSNGAKLKKKDVFYILDNKELDLDFLAKKLNVSTPTVKNVIKGKVFNRFKIEWEEKAKAWLEQNK